MALGEGLDAGRLPKDKSGDGLFVGPETVLVLT